MVELTASTDPAVLLEIEQIATDVWRSRASPDGRSAAMDVQVRHDFLPALRSIRSVNVSSVVHDDVLALIEAQHELRGKSPWSAAEASAAAAAPPELDPFFDEYRTGDKTERWMQVLAAQHPSTVAYTDTIGPSIEGRNIPALTIGGTAGVPAIYMQAVLHPGGSRTQRCSTSRPRSSTRRTRACSCWCATCASVSTRNIPTN